MSRHSEFGFTLIELLVVMGIVIILTSLGAIVGTKTLQHQEITRTVDIVRSELATARSHAFSGTNDTAWGVAFFDNRAVRFSGATYSARNASDDRTSIFSSTISITGASEIDFTRPEGIPQTPATLTITDGTSTYTITIAATGSISVTRSL